jgi:predicted transposase YbfD/YdcC
MCRQFDMPRECTLPVPEWREEISLAGRLRDLPDPRDARGRRHGLWCVILIAASAVVAGADSYAAIAQWAAPAPQPTLTRLGARLIAGLGIRVSPSGATIRRVIEAVCPDGLATLIGAGIGAADTLAVDGKAARGSRHNDIPAAHLLAAMTLAGQVAAQIRIPDKTNEIGGFRDLLQPLDLAGVIVTADAMHAQRDHARFLVEEKKAHYVLTVKRNQPTLHERLRTLPWNQVRCGFYDRTKGHGRRDTRVTKVLTVDDLDFPHVAQVAHITRHSTCVKTGKRTRETVYVITSLTSAQASPQRLALIVRGHWRIEALHYVRDVTFGEDASKIHTGHGPENMAALRNLAHDRLRNAGFDNIAAARREMSYDTFTAPLDLLGIA